MTNTELRKPTMESILELFNGPQMAGPSSRVDAACKQQYSTYEGAELIPKFMDDDSEDT